MSFSHILLFSNSFRPGRTSCPRDYNDFAATSAPPHPHPLPVDPRHLDMAATPYRPSYDHHIDPTTLPPPRHGLTAASTPSRDGRRCLDPPTTLSPTPRTSTRTSANSTQPPPPPRRLRHLPVHPASTPPHRCCFDTTSQLATSSFTRDPQTSSHSPI
ncbi:hypothetical protein EDB86DRAFT_2987619, partial [Lactarius hatsudake]